MNNINEVFFSPLSKEYCVYFYFVTVVLFVILILAMFTMIISIFKSKKKDNYLLMMSNILTLALVYFQNRLLYSMCVN
uniref:Uncharacterized protein n=1 Tax=viral metagenome TaxID=1070528 RepID=A0A6C0KZ14_9ZZZZ